MDYLTKKACFFILQNSFIIWVGAPQRADNVVPVAYAAYSTEAYRSSYV